MSFVVHVDRERCRICGRCEVNCSFGAIKVRDKVLANHKKCVACRRCEALCPEDAIYIENIPEPVTHEFWTPDIIDNIHKQASTGGILITGTGNPRPYPIIWDGLLLDACQVTNPSIDPLREPMEIRTYLGRKPEFTELRNSDFSPPQIKLETPIVFAAMSYGAISLNSQKALAMAASRMGTLMNTGEGGLHREIKPYRDHIIVQCASGRFGVENEYLNSGAVVEIKIGQGAKPGIGGHLPGEKIVEEISMTRMIPVGTDAISPAPHHDIYSIEDLQQLIYALKEVTNYEKPVSVKVAAVHNIAAIASGIARAGADIITIDGFRGGTGATPVVIRDNVGIPIAVALAVVDQRLRDEGIRDNVSLLCGGGIRHSGDLAKAIALGADAVVIGTAALIALGCNMCQKCTTGSCAWGIASQRPELTARQHPEEGALKLANLLRSWSIELKEVMGSLGLNSIESLRGNRERLRGFGLDTKTLEILGIKAVGEGQ